MYIKIKSLIKKNTEIFALSVLVLITVISTNYYNYDKKKIMLNKITTKIKKNTEIFALSQCFDIKGDIKQTFKRGICSG